MNFTYRQRQVSWKPNYRTKAVPKTSKPNTNKHYIDDDNSTFESPFGTARPLKQYRKQIQPYYKTASGNSVSVNRVDAPNGDSYTSSETCDNIIYDYVIRKPSPCLGDKFGNVCRGGSNHITRPGKTVIDKTYHTTMSSYLKSKCSTYSQKSLVSDKIDGEENAYKMTNCTDSKCSKTYYKPNNSKFKTQGAVSSSNRLLELKYNTIKKNAASLKNTYGTAARNASTYSNNLRSVYSEKSKDNLTKSNGGKLNKPLNMRIRETNCSC